jgi:acetolactate synthase-1/2/3 large subunit
MLQGRGALQDIDQLALFKPHVKWSRAVKRLRDLAPAIQKAFQVAQTGVPGPVFVECPVDLLYDEEIIREWYAEAAPRGSGLSNQLMRAYLNRHARRLFAGTGAADQVATEVAAPAPASHVIDRAAQKIAGAKRPLLIVGSQALVDARQADATAQAIESIGIPVYLSGRARGLMGPSHRLHRRHQCRKAIREADVVLLAGVPSDFRLDYGRHVRKSACLISANRSRTDLNRNRRPDIGAIADAGLFLRRLADALGTDIPARWDEWQETLLARDSEREAEIDRTAASTGELVNPVSLLRSIDAELPDKSAIVADGGDFVGTASYIVKPRGPLCWLDPGVFGTLGCGAGFALGASLCRPDHEIWIVFGDGSVGYALAEFDTFVRHGIPVIAVVGNDASWAQIAREQVKMLDDDVGTVLARSSYHEVAAALGGQGILLKDNDQIRDSLKEARDAVSKGVPVLINAWLDKTDFREGSLSM